MIIAMGTSDTYYNAGIGGNTAAQVDTRISALLTSKAPKVVILHVGINDIWGDVTWGTFSASLDSIKSKVTAAGAVLVVDEILPDCESSCHMCSDILLWNGYLATWCTANGATLVTGLYNAVLGTGGCLSIAYDVGDSVHLNVAGYTLMGQTIAPFVNNILHPPIHLTNGKYNQR
jgi:lysophospholipase L1-like esterase